MDEDEERWTTFERLYVFLGVMLVSVVGLWTCKASKEYRDARATPQVDVPTAPPQVVPGVPNPLERGTPRAEPVSLP